MVSSVSTGPTPRHSSVSKIVIMVQSLVILSLSLWIVEEYLNNMYLREYVSSTFQTDGLMIGLLGTLLVFGCMSSLMLMRRRHGEKRFGAVSLEITPVAPKVKLGAPMISKPSEASAKPLASSVTLSGDFHPVVAALKADMAERRLSFGSLLGAGTEQPTTAPAPSLNVQKTSVLDQLTPNRQPPLTGPPVAGPRPGQSGAPFPQRPLPVLGPQQPTGPRPEQAGTSLAQWPMPVLRSQQPAGSSVLQPPEAPASQVKTTVTTVITGILPAQKKRDPSAPPEEKPSSQ